MYKVSLKGTLVETKFGIKSNKRLLSKEDSIKFFMNNMEELVERTKDEKYPYEKPDNLEEIIDELFSMDNVYVAATPCEDHFDKEGNYVGEFATLSYRHPDERGIIESVKGFLDKGATVYLYTFHKISQDIVVPDSFEMKDTYWFRIMRKK